MKYRNTIFTIIINLLLYLLIARNILGYSSKLEYHTNWGFGHSSIFILLLIIIFVLIYFSFRKYRKYNFGISSIIAAFILAMFFHTNNQFSNQGSYQGFKVTDSYSTRDSCFHKILFNEFSVYVGTDLRYSINLDTIHFQVDTGYFQTLIFRPKYYKVIEKHTSNKVLNSDNLKNGEYLITNRYFNEALDQLSICIESDSLNYKCYFNRSLAYMALEKHELAFSDLINSFILEFNGLENYKLTELTELNMKTYLDSFIQKVDSREFSQLGEISTNIDKRVRLENYNERIKFCVDKIETGANKKTYEK